MSHPAASYPAASYPAAQYTGDGGEVSGVLRPDATPREIDNGERGGVRYLATGASTGGQLGLYRWEMGPQPGGPSGHFHRTISESFYVLSGEVRLFDGDSWRTGRPGDFLYVPPGGIHGFRNESGRPATMLILFTPGAPREDYFETLADEERRAALQDEDVGARTQGVAVTARRARRGRPTPAAGSGRTGALPGRRRPVSRRRAD